LNDLKGVYMSKRGKKPKVGDVFAIPIDDKRYAYGQLVANGFGSDCYVTYDITAETHPELEQIVSSPIVFRIFTLHQLIVNGIWIIIGNASISQKIYIPEFKVESTENKVKTWMVQSYDGTILRPASTEEIERLNYMESFTPNMLDNAVKAKYGVLSWKPHYNKILYNNENDSTLNK